MRSAVFQCVSVTLLDMSSDPDETYIICIYNTTACQTRNTLHSANSHQAGNKHRVSRNKSSGFSLDGMLKASIVYLSNLVLSYPVLSLP